MAARVIKVPDIGEGIAEVELVEWLVKVGDTVAEDQSLAVVMTDKASVEIPSPVAGTVVALAGDAGQMLAVGAELIRIEPAGAGEATAARGGAGAAAGGTAAPGGPGAAVGEAAAHAEVRAAMGAAGVSVGGAVGTSVGGAPVVAAVAAHVGFDKPLASPSVRRHARDRGIDLRQVSGSGPAGRIRHEDVERFAARAMAAAAGVAAPAPAGAAAGAQVRGGPAMAAPAAAVGRAPAGPRYAERHDEQAVPVIGLRRRIAEKMQEAKRRIPHFSYVEEVDVTELEALRAQLNAKRGAERGRLTLLPFVLRAIVLAVREFPQINARYDDEANVVTRYGAVHVGIATQSDAGLMVPVLRHAEALDLWATAAEISRLAQAARSGKALRDELSGSTITVTSLGALGGIASTPVINHPEVAIVGVNRIAERPVILGGAVVARKMMNLSSSFDHRVVDGMHGAEFVQALRGYLECPATMFVD
ncbi:MAG: branched-chain alpha-keto acid dehydrogenase subunit E2 [Lautropia sp. SCN 69-89]|nr:MAG: branched-chain alpha-keto acid dehydrogenase subunit E2 [Lautropia sp. SCN 69-89]